MGSERGPNAPRLSSRRESVRHFGVLHHAYVQGLLAGVLGAAAPLFHRPAVLDSHVVEALAVDELTRGPSASPSEARCRSVGTLDLDSHVVEALAVDELTRGPSASPSVARCRSIGTLDEVLHTYCELRVLASVVSTMARDPPRPFIGPEPRP
jgi:hypothetical protein